jgi:isochorismate synthase
LKEIKERLSTSYKNKNPFVVYNKPNSGEVFGLFQRNNQLHEISNEFYKSGFVFAPFSSTEKTVLIPMKESEFIQGSYENIDISAIDFEITEDELIKKIHENLVKSGVEAIQKNRFQKVVLSRKETVAITDFDIYNTYNKLLQLYPNAFVYVWFHPNVGLWFGATPETLVRLENQEFTTMSLAGTQSFSEHPKWTEKEKVEQQLVTDYIVEKLSRFSVDLKLTDATTVKAGSLVHLQTTIKGRLDASVDNGLYSLVELLHPTPAVCGLPKEVAKEFILMNENYNRSYYTGYLGELNMNGKNLNDSHLFVNLRCMEVESSTANIYVGGGITDKSIPSKEWEETKEKSKIMRKVL